MGLRGRFRDWCPRPPNPISTKLKRYFAPIAIMLAVTVFSMSLFASSSGYLLGSSALKPLPVLPLSAQTSASPGITQLWNVTWTGSLPNSSPAFSDSRLYAETAGGSGVNSYAYCLNASTGAQEWNFSIGDAYLTTYSPYGFVFSPVVSGAYVYAGGSVISQSAEYHDVIYCLNASTGNELWNFTYPGLFNFAPAVANGYLYAVAGNGNVYAVNAATGASIWNYTTGGTIQSSPAAANNILYVSSASTVFALNGLTGMELWNYPTSSSAGPVTVGNGVVYFASGNLLYSLDAATGTQIWNASTPQAVATVNSPAVADGMVYVSSNAAVYAFSASTGAQAWNQTTAGVATIPVISGGNVYLGSNGTSVCSLNASTGAETWSFTILPYQTAIGPFGPEGPIFLGMGLIQGGPTLYTPTVADGVVYISLSASAWPSPNGGDVQNVGVLFALGTPAAVTPTPMPLSPSSPLSSPTEFIIIGGSVAVVIVVVFVDLKIKKRLRPIMNE